MYFKYNKTDFKHNLHSGLHNLTRVSLVSFGISCVILLKVKCPLSSSPMASPSLLRGSDVSQGEACERREITLTTQHLLLKVLTFLHMDAFSPSHENLISVNINAESLL